MESKTIGVIIIFTILGAGSGFFYTRTIYEPQIEDLSTNSEQQDTQIELFTQAVVQKEEENQFLNSSLKNLETDYNDLVNEHDSLTAELESLSTQLDSLESDFETLNENYNSLSESYSTLSDQHQELTIQLTELETEYNELLSEYERVVGALPLEQISTSQETFDKSYTWYYMGSQYTLSLSIPESHYQYYRSLDRIPSEDYSIYVTHPYDDEYIGVIIRKFNNIAIENGYTELQKVNLIISFVQNLPYTTDSVTTDYDEYPRFPLETLVDGGGDCEDSSILTAALLDALNYQIVLLGLPAHMAVGVDIPAYGTYYEYEGEQYFYLETTSGGWQLGDFPEEYEGTSAYVYPLVPTAIISHDWTAEWKYTANGYALEVIVNIQNVGTEAAYGLKAYSAYDAGEDMVWYPEESEPFDLNFGKETSIILTLNPLSDKYTRLIVGVIDAEGYLIDVSYSEWFNTN